MADEFIILGLDICFEDYYASEYMKDHIFELWKKIDRVIHTTYGVVKSKPVCVTTMINHVLIPFSAVQIYDLSYIHLHSTTSMGISSQLA